MTALDRAWIGLALLTAASTAVALGALPAPISGLLVLALAWAKARLIFLWYLDLHDVPGWRGGIQFGLALFVVLLMVLYAAA
ncbi:cytochrome C oxidase subunit IV family protein [Ovoidimarina sediminis]|uniref:cytochrome C oxidase subunit IV family protein n=1 Tax=Ovoidimarina sediminis TaxID=3079856 RepID=UPI00291120F6|nr:cytochrome C oxidase subunit IV family protein [Rhodophyticola sp. MJ-SS7]MDU8941852.1 cytochrome C oxidase subunit IV family protein [Rhodophyticola sp. MJ-SS7]